MNPLMKEGHGNTEGLSSANKSGRIFVRTAAYVLTRPPCLAVFWVSWHFLRSLCWYGRLGRNVPILICCLLWWLCAVGYGLWLYKGYSRGGRDGEEPPVFRTLLPDREGLTLAGTDGQGGQREETITGASVKWYVKRKAYCQLFLRDRRTLFLDLRGLGGEEKDFLDLKLSAVSFFGKGTWRAAAGAFLLAVGLHGACQVWESAIPYNGKLSWYLDDLKDKRTVDLWHDNVYDTGIQGVLEDIRRKVDLPETLCLSTSFNLHFAPDGRILTFDTMLNGFDEDGEFTGSYLITYNERRSRKITIYLHGADSGTYQQEKDLKPLVDAVSVMPLRETVEAWEGESCYGILYYGERVWDSGEGIRFLDGHGDWWLPEDLSERLSGYSISVFCPENQETTPVRYLYEGWWQRPF